MDANNLKKAFELFVKLQDKKVKLSNVDGKIKYRAPSGIMTNEVIEEIRKCKNELLTIINCTEHPEKLWKTNASGIYDSIQYTCNEIAINI